MPAPITWDEEKFERFLTAAVAMARGQLPGYGYRHVVFPYEPQVEMSCIEEMRRLPLRLSQAGLQSHSIPIAKLVASITARHAVRDLEDAEEYERLERDLASLTVGVIPKTAALCAQEIREKSPEDCVIILYRLGALYPFGQVSALLNAIYQSGIRHTLAVAYPGTAEGTALHFLGMLDPTGGYRGHVVT